MKRANAEGWISRSERVVNRPEQFSGFVYFNRGQQAGGRPAQFVDVSTSGMKLISRMPCDVTVGELLQIEFTLPGTKERIVSHGRVVRKKNEFVFAVRFFLDANQRKVIQRAVRRYAEHARNFSTIALIQSIKTWWNRHQTGLVYAMIGLALSSAIAAFLYLHSDEHRGRALRSWGAMYPKSWSIDYYGTMPDGSAK